MMLLKKRCKVLMRFGMTTTSDSVCSGVYLNIVQYGNLHIKIQSGRCPVQACKDETADFSSSLLTFAERLLPPIAAAPPISQEAQRAAQAAAAVPAAASLCSS